jgi:hypothetical protein
MQGHNGVLEFLQWLFKWGSRGHVSIGCLVHAATLRIVTGRCTRLEIGGVLNVVSILCDGLSLEDVNSIILSGIRGADSAGGERSNHRTWIMRISTIYLRTWRVDRWMVGCTKAVSTTIRGDLSGIVCEPLRLEIGEMGGL